MSVVFCSKKERRNSFRTEHCIRTRPVNNPYIFIQNRSNQITVYVPSRIAVTSHVHNNLSMLILYTFNQIPDVISDFVRYVRFKNVQCCWNIVEFASKLPRKFILVGARLIISYERTSKKIMWVVLELYLLLC